MIKKITFKDYKDTKWSEALHLKYLFIPKMQV